MKSKKMTFDEIKQELSRDKIYLSDIASALNVSNTHVINVAQNIGTSKKVATAIAKCLRKDINQVFGNKYVDRSVRSAQVIAAIKENAPIPKSCNQVYVHA